MKRVILTLFLSIFSISAQSALYDRGGGLIYDDVLDITWLQDGKYAMTSGHVSPSTHGRMTWSDATSWVDGLSYFDPVRNMVWDDWRLAAFDLDGDGYVLGCYNNNEVACRDNELEYMYYFYGVTKGSPSPFFNLDIYWSSDVAGSSTTVWTMAFEDGQTGHVNKTGSSKYGVWAVREGDVAATVPVPAAAWLFGSALGLMGWMRRKKI